MLEQLDGKHVKDACPFKARSSLSTSNLLSKVVVNFNIDIWKTRDDVARVASASAEVQTPGLQLQPECGGRNPPSFPAFTSRMPSHRMSVCCSDGYAYFPACALYPSQITTSPPETRTGLRMQGILWGKPGGSVGLRNAILLQCGCQVWGGTPQPQPGRQGALPTRRRRWGDMIFLEN